MIEASADGRDGPRGTALWSTGPMVGGGDWWPESCFGKDEDSSSASNSALEFCASLSCRGSDRECLLIRGSSFSASLASGAAASAATYQRVSQTVIAQTQARHL